MSRKDNFLEGFGIGPAEQEQMEVRAREGAQLDSVDANSAFEDHDVQRLLQHGYSQHHIKVDDDGRAYTEHTSGPWVARYHGGNYLNVFHSEYGDHPIEALHVDSTPHKRNAIAHQKRLEEWHKESGGDYEKHVLPYAGD